MPDPELTQEHSTHRGEAGDYRGGFDGARLRDETVAQVAAASAASGAQPVVLALADWEELEP